jgi:formylglycine-generating enzyme required for sulfatase activity
VDISPLLEEELRKFPGAEASEAEKEALGQRQARAALALLRMNRKAEVYSLLKSRPDPRARSYFINWARDFGVSALDLIGPLIPAPVGEEASIQQALLLTLGEVRNDGLSPQQQQALVEHVLQIYRDHPDSGLHGAAAWLLRQWKLGERLLEIDEQLRQSEPRVRSRPSTDGRRWYVNSQGVTYVILEAEQFRMGSPDTEDDREAGETSHLRQIGRTFAIAATEVTRGQFQQYLRTVHGEDVEASYVMAVAEESKTEDSPAIRVTWFDAAEYCNWLSEQDGIAPDQWCYKPNESGEFYVGMKPVHDYLTLSGYRLPTEAEWEYACRAGTLTSRHFGASTHLLDRYARYEANSDRHVWPVAELKPNDFGLFDILGNVHEWCHERYRPDSYGGEEPVLDTIDIQQVAEGIGRVSRGGAFRHFAWQLRSAYRGYGDPANRSSSFGFRPARTIR